MRPFRHRLRWIIPAVLVCSASTLFANDEEVRTPTKHLRIGFSEEMFEGVNFNDARTALKVLFENLAATRGVAIEAHLQTFRNVDDLDDALSKGTVDVVELTVAEYARVAPENQLASFFLGASQGEVAEQFVLLVHRNSGIRALSDLRDRRINLFSHYRTALARPWLENLLADAELLPVETFCTLRQETKLTRTVLPVFFRQSDACIVTQSAFDIMNELNPQMGLELVVIATSPPIVPALMCFRDEGTAQAFDELVQALRELHTNPAGRQILNIFQRDQFLESDPAVLQPAVDMLNRHKQLTAAQRTSHQK